MFFLFFGDHFNGINLVLKKTFLLLQIELFKFLQVILFLLLFFFNISFFVVISI